MDLICKKCSKKHKVSTFPEFKAFWETGLFCECEGLLISNMTKISMDSHRDFRALNKGF